MVTQQRSAETSGEAYPEAQKPKVRIRQLFSSVFAAALGVQSSKNRDRDFKQGSVGVFVIAGILFTGLFVAGVITVVQVVIANH